MKDLRKRSAELEAMAYELINEEPELEYIKGSNAKIAYLISEAAPKEKDHMKLGCCEKVADKNRWAIEEDYTVTLFAPNIEGMSQPQIRILLFHELLHIQIEMDGEEEKYTVRPHDLEDFKVIIDRYGTDWASVKE